MKEIKIEVPAGLPPGGHSWVQPVLVDWFPPLTEQQILENALAAAWGRQPPHDDPNLLNVVVRIR